MSDYGIFRKRDAQRIARQTRRLEGIPGRILHVPERIGRLTSSGGAGTGGGGGTSGPFTIQEYDAAGDVVHQFDRGRSRTSVSPAIEDTALLISSDEAYLYAIGRGELNADSGCITKWNLSTYEMEWRSDRNGLNATPVNSSFAVDNRLDRILFEASDGYIWACSNVAADATVRVSRTDPATGIQSQSVSDGANFGYALFRADGSGSVIAANGSAATGGNYLAVIDSGGSITATSNTAVVSVAQAGDYVVFCNATTLTVLNADDLTSVSTRANPASEAYISVVTDGVTVWTHTFNSGAGTYKIRAYDITNLATETFNNSLTATPSFLFYKGGYLFTAGARVDRLSTVDGSTTWSQTSLGSPVRGTCIDVGSDFVVYASSGSGAYTVWCFDLSSGSIRWKDFITGFRSVAVTSDDRIFVSSARNTA